MDVAAFPLQIKQLSDSGEIVGIAAAFNNIDLGGDRIIPGAFAKSLADHHSAGTAPAMLLHHDTRRPCGVWTDLTETPSGLIAKGRLTLGAADGREAYALCRDGAIKGLSVGYIPDQYEHARDARELKVLKLVEVSLVAVPMNDRTRITAVKSITGVRDIEDVLKSGGMSNRQAKAAASAAWRAIHNPNEDDAAQAALNAAIARLQTL